MIDWILFAIGMALAFLIIELQYKSEKKRQGKK